MSTIFACREGFTNASNAATNALACMSFAPRGLVKTPASGDDVAPRVCDQHPRLKPPPEWGATNVDLLTLEHCSGCVNETFRAEINEGEIEFVLVEARPIPPPPGNLLRTPFALLFRNTSSFQFPQQSYCMRHGRLDEIGIFLVPVAREREGFLYQAIFN